MVPAPSRRKAAPPEPLDLTDEDQERLRRAQLELLGEFDRVCRAVGVEYFAVYGTLLGAARHQGFIPWDDDLDVGMLRADYDLLCERIDDVLGERYFFQTVRSDPHYGCMFAKLRLNGTRCVDADTYGSPQHSGVFIDVFPIDAKAPGGLARREQKAMRYVGFRLMYLKARYPFMKGTSPLSRTIQAIARGVVRILPRRFLIALAERNTRRGGSDATELVSLFGAYVYDKDTLDPAWIRPVGSLPFEDTTIPVPADPDAYLRQIYGDWRQPPPVEQQVGHHAIVELSFDDQP